MPVIAEKLVWIDCEMTGLDPTVDELVEIAVIVTDYDLHPLGEGLDLVIRPSEQALAGMNDFVRDMHTSSGLLGELESGMSLADAESAVLAYLETYLPGDQQAVVAGNSIATDRAFLYRYMPGLSAKLHYRSVDVSSIKELSRRWSPKAYFKAPAKQGGHRALADIVESIAELAYYRESVFRDEAQLESVDFAESADTVSKRYTGLV